jgi:hypothetical protein
LVSDSERPDAVAFHELSALIRMLGDEMAAWRRRAHEAEQRVKELESSLPTQGSLRIVHDADAKNPLEKENQDLRARLATASERTRQLVERLHFLRQQHGAGAER